jgi:hypothetical protein
VPEIRDEISHVLEADGQPQQILGSPCRRAFNGSTMLDEALDAAETRSASEEFKARGGRQPVALRIAALCATAAWQRRKRTVDREPRAP